MQNFVLFVLNWYSICAYVYMGVYMCVCVYVCVYILETETLGLHYHARQD